MKPITRRKLLTTGFAATAGVAGVAAAAHLAERYGLIPLTVAAFTARAPP